MIFDPYQVLLSKKKFNRYGVLFFLNNCNYSFSVEIKLNKVKSSCVEASFKLRCKQTIVYNFAYICFVNKFLAVFSNN